MAAKTSVSSSVPIPSSRPLPLSASQEQQVQELYHARVRGYCAEEIKSTKPSLFIHSFSLSEVVCKAQAYKPRPDFAKCAANRTVTATWKCRTERLSMNGCMLAHASFEEQDKARTEWFATMEERRTKREEQAVEREKQKKIHHDWWGLDEKGNRVAQTNQEGKRGWR
ncbi:MAG: hypothetical protein M1814_000845 [Vezdaea aestivalis]|nr:MAG: hypothetical protein M1814_000845 [Vezdaea aestivalis]